MLRDRIAQALPEWSAAKPRFASVLAMYAFGLEENGQYRQAEKAARRALALDPGHPGAIHVVAHVLEMQGRARGSGVPRRDESGLERRNLVLGASRLARRPFDLDCDDIDTALTVYDRQIAGASDLNALSDASALLWRLWLRNVDVGARWRRLADHWESQPLAGTRAFYVEHAIMAFAAAGRALVAARAAASLPDPGAGPASQAALEDALAASVGAALCAFAG